MKNLTFKLIAFTMLFSFAYAKTGVLDHKTIGVFSNNVNIKQPKVDSFKIIGESYDEVNKRCSITVNYYNQGQYVGQQTYSGNTATLCGVTTCGQWRDNMMSAINSWVNANETMYPSCNDCAC
ncbi:hypothetical protein [Chryseobacterium paridis]|uniref:Uncharacterized protein n=1 Tax=Chryseobacterium paridis TaxID=2800328 RepID=A0ABS1FYE0_9FLAO|nr:hypothetical protein [Chryseobacterium paridis]MBK1897471.1 hypothetical protein [Chryseobacterium paridis]